VSATSVSHPRASTRSVPATEPVELGGIMDNLVRLRNTLRRALEQEEGVGTQELFEALQVSLPTLKRVGKPQEKSPQERRELEAGE
jgi:hypothetical protein